MSGSPIVYAALTLAFGLVGGLLPLFSKIKDNPERLKMLTGIAAGIIIASAILVVIPEGFELAKEEHVDEEHVDEEHANSLLLGGAVLSGFVFMLIIEGSGIGHAVHEEHHEHNQEHGHKHIHHGPGGWILVLGLTIHAATDGLAIGAASASGGTVVTAAVALSVLIHKAPTAFSLGIFSMHERENRNDSIRDVLIFSLATPIMIMIAYYTLEGFENHIIGLAMLFSAGTFLYVATVDTLPDIHNPETGKKALTYVLIGILFLTLILLGMDFMNVSTHDH